MTGALKKKLGKRAADLSARKTPSSSPAIKAEAALGIWQRTLLYETPLLRFAMFLSDGDSKAYNGVRVVKAYNAAAIGKEDCSNVQSA